MSPESRTPYRTLRGWSRLTSLAAMLVGSLVLVGWWLNLTNLKSVLPGLTTMKPNTASAFLLLGLGLWLTLRPPTARWHVGLRRLCLGLVCLLGLLTLCEYLLGWRLGIDTVLFPAALSTVDPYPGRMAPVTALNFLLLGLALGLLETNGRFRLAQLLTLLAGLLTLLALIGYLYGVKELYQLSSYSALALHTAFTFLVLCTGLLLARPDQGWMNILTGPGPAGRLARRLLSAAILIPAVVGWLCLLGQAAGWYDGAFALALFAIANMVIFVILIAQSAASLHATDVARQQAEDQLQQLVADLEARILDRTNELLAANQRLEVDMTVQQQRERELQRLKSALDRMAEGAQIIGPDWRYIYLNDAAARQGQRAKDELIGQTMPAAYPGIDQTPLFTLLRRCLAEQTSEHLENPFTFPDGTQGWFDLSVQPMPDGIFILSTDITDRKRAEAALRYSEAKLRALFDVLPVGISILDRQRRTVESNPALEWILGLTKEGLALGLERGRQYIHPDGTPMRPAEFASVRAFTEQQAIHDVEMGVITEVGQTIWTNVSAAPLLVADLSVVVVTTDITERKRIEAALTEERDLMQALMDNVPDPIYFKDTASRFTRVNRAQAQVLGLTEAAQAIGQTDAAFQAEALAADTQQAEQALFAGGPALINHLVLTPTSDGQPRWFSTTKMPLHDKTGQVTGLVGISRDITAYKQLEEQLRHLAAHDSLTGLPNRGLLMDRLGQAFERARRRPGQRFAALYLDLDHFKAINDSLGHLAGDTVLRTAAQRLQAAVRAEDTVGRLGGDEFAIVLDSITDVRDALQVADRIQQSMVALIRAGDRPIYTAASIGIAVSGPEYQAPGELLRDADAALYQAKQRGRGQVVVFTLTDQPATPRVRP